MAIYDLDKVPGALVEIVSKSNTAFRYEKHYNPLAKVGLAVGDIVLFKMVLPDWTRSFLASKRTNTSNADIVTVITDDSALPIQLHFPFIASPTVQTSGSVSSSAASSVIMQLYPIGNIAVVSCQIAGTVPAQFLLSAACYDN